VSFDNVTIQSIELTDMYQPHIPSHSDSKITALLANRERFLHFLESRVGSRHDAEEILQFAFVRSLQKAEEIRESESVIAWFYRLLRNAVVDHYRRNASQQRSLESFARQLSDESRVDSDTERVLCECVTALVPTLKPEYAEVIQQVDLQGGELNRVAEGLGITPGNARVRLHRARAALREEVDRTCRMCATHGCVDCTCGKGPECDRPAN
jgi:RNA polymerase sigma factor (sigma-70 family)